MTKNQFRKAIAALGLSQGAAAEFLGVSLRSVAGWALGEQPVPHAVGMLLSVMIARSMSVAEVKQISK